jgi:hypothetical protein
MLFILRFVMDNSVGKFLFERHNPYGELSDVFDQHFTLRQVEANSYFKLIPTGNFRLYDYNRGLCWISLDMEVDPDGSNAEISVSVGNIDDGSWGALTSKIELIQDSIECFERLKKVVNDLLSLPTEAELIALLGDAAKPIAIVGEFE